MEHQIIETPDQMTLEPENETNDQLINFKLEYNNDILDFSLFEINNQKLKLIIIENDYKKSELKKYEAILELNQLKTAHKYFRMFDDYNEFKNNFIKLCNPNNIKITYHNISAIEIKIDLKLISNNLFTITLNEIQMGLKEKFKFIIKELNEKSKIVNDLNVKIKEYEKDLNLKGNKIANLEKDIKDLKMKDLKKEKEIREIKSVLNGFKNNKNIKYNKNYENKNKISLKEEEQKDNDKKIDEIMDYLEKKYYINNWLDDDEAKNKIKELKYNLKDIEKWIENLL